MILRSMCLLALSAISGFTAPHVLNFAPLQAEFSQPLNRLVFTADAPARLYLCPTDQGCGTPALVNLPSTPLGLSLSPDGQRAAVGVATGIVLVDLNPLQIARTIPMPGAPAAIALGSQWVYATAQSEADAPKQTIYSFPTAGGAGSTYLLPTRMAGLRVAGAHEGLYGTAGTKVYGLYRLTNTTGPVSNLIDPPMTMTDPNWGAYLGYSDLVPSRNGEFLLSLNGYRFRTSTMTDLDQTMAGNWTLFSSVSESDNGDIAAIPFSFNLPSSIVSIFRADTGLLADQRPISFLPGSSLRPNGRYLFQTPDGAHLYVISHTVDADHPRVWGYEDLAEAVLTECASVTVTGQSALLNLARGSLTRAGVTAPGCHYEAVPNVPWIELTMGQKGYDSGQLEILVRPNTSGSPRTGKVIIGSTEIVINQPSDATPGVIPGYGYDARFEQAIGRFRYGPTASWGEVDLYNPQTREEWRIRIPGGRSPVFSEDGKLMYAVTNHRLATFEVASGEMIHSVAVPMFPYGAGLLVPKNGWAYLFPNVWLGVKADGYSVRLSDGLVVRSNIPQMANSGALLAPDRQSIISFSGGVARFTLGDGPLALDKFTAGQGCGYQAAFAAAATRIGACDQQFKSAPGQPDDLEPVATLPYFFFAQAYSPELRVTAGLMPPEIGASYQRIAFYSDDDPSSVSNIVTLSKPLSSYTGVLSWNSTGNTVYLSSIDSDGAGLASVRIDADACNFRFTSAPGYLAADSSAGSVSVTGDANCVWAVTSSASWLKVTTPIGAGNGTVRYSAGVNLSTSARSANLIAGGRMITVVQNGAEAQSSVPLLTIGQGGGTLYYPVTAATAWTATSPAGWVTFPIASGSTPRMVAITVGANQTGASRSVVITVGGQQVRVLQSYRLAAPVLLPAEAVTNPTLAWKASAGATVYRIQIAATVGAFGADPSGDGCTGCLVNQAVDGTFFRPEAALTAAYLWRVRAYSSGSSSDWTTPQSVTPSGASARRLVSIYRAASGQLAAVVPGTATPFLSGGDLGAMTNAPPALAQTAGGLTYAVALDRFGSLWLNSFTAANAWEGWVSLGGELSSSPTVTLGADGTLYIAAIDRYQAVWLTSYTKAGGRSAWVNLGGIFAPTPPAMAAHPDGSLVLAATDTWKGMWSGRYQPDSTEFSGWSFGGGIIQGTPALATGTDGVVYLAVLDPQGGLWRAALSGTAWLGWTSGGGTLTGSPQLVARGDGTMTAVVRDNAQGVWTRSFAESDPAGWLPWSYTGGVLGNFGAAAAGGDLKLAGVNPEGKLWFYASGTWTESGVTGLPAADGNLSAAPR